MNFVNLNKPVNNLKPATGRLLIAEPFLADPNFSRSVVLLCEYNDEGAVGFVLNHPTHLTLSDLVVELEMSALSVSQGGPVQMDTLHMLHRVPQLLGGNEVAPGIYWGGSYEALQEALLAKTFNTADIKLFVGYSGWSAGQLEKELEEGSWIITNAAPNILFETNAKEVWKEAIRTLGSQYAYLENMPINPQLN